jgi:hypothetical protein
MNAKDPGQQPNRGDKPKGISEMKGLANMFTTLSETMANVEARVASIEEKLIQQASLLEKLSSSLLQKITKEDIGEESSLIEAVVESHESVHSQIQDQVLDIREHVQAVREGLSSKEMVDLQHKSLAKIVDGMTSGRSTGWPIGAKCDFQWPAPRVDQETMQFIMDFGHYKCDITWDIPIVGKGKFSLFDMNLNWGPMSPAEVLQKAGDIAKKFQDDPGKVFQDFAGQIGLVKDLDSALKNSTMHLIEVGTTVMKDLVRNACPAVQASLLQGGTHVIHQDRNARMRTFRRQPGSLLETLDPDAGDSKCFQFERDWRLNPSMGDAVGAGFAMDVFPASVGVYFSVCLNGTIGEVLKKVAGGSTIGEVTFGLNGMGKRVLELKIPIKLPENLSSTIRSSSLLMHSEQDDVLLETVNSSQPSSSRPWAMLDAFSVAAGKGMERLHSCSGDEAMELVRKHLGRKKDQLESTAEQSRSDWECHEYSPGQDDNWCQEQVPICCQEYEYKFSLDLAASPCGCACCQRKSTNAIMQGGPATNPAALENKVLFKVDTGEGSAVHFVLEGYLKRNVFHVHFKTDVKVDLFDIDVDIPLLNIEEFILELLNDLNCIPETFRAYAMTAVQMALMENSPVRGLAKVFGGNT